MSSEMVSRRSPSRSFDASIVQTWENKCKRGFVLDYETLKCVSAASARGKELMSAERRAKTVLASGKTTKQKLFGVLKVAGALTGGTVAAYLAYLASSSATSAAFARLLRSASAQASVDISVDVPKIVKAAEAAQKTVEVIVAAKDTTKTLLRKTVRALATAGIAGLIFGKMRVPSGGGGGGGTPYFGNNKPGPSGWTPAVKNRARSAVLHRRRRHSGHVATGMLGKRGRNDANSPMPLDIRQRYNSPQGSLDTLPAIRNMPRSSSSPATIAYVPEQQVRQRGGNRSSAVGAGWAPQSPPVIVNSGHFVAARTPSPPTFTSRFARLDRNARERYPMMNASHYTF